MDGAKVTYAENSEIQYKIKGFFTFKKYIQPYNIFFLIIKYIFWGILLRNKCLKVL